MEFRTKDLMITVLPREADIAKACLLHTKYCINPTFDCGCSLKSPYTCRPFTHPCGFITDPCGPFTQVTCGLPSHCQILSPWNTCGPISPYCGGGSICGYSDIRVIQRVEDIAAVREDLKATLKSLDDLEKSGLPPQPSAGELADVESRLESALKEVREQKAKASKKG